MGHYDIVDVPPRRGADTADILAVAQPPQDVVAAKLRAGLRALVVGATQDVTVGRYVLGELLGQGGMGRVYAARDPELKRDVAIKLVPLADRDPSRAVREARAMAQVSHPNIVPVYDVGLVDDELYVVMERVGGPTLRTWLRVDRSPREIIDKLVAAGHGLAAAHRAGIVHHDFKPDNVMLAADGRVMVTDFGLAAIAQRETSECDSEEIEPEDVESTHSVDGSTTAAGGTFGYIAPERLAGRRGDARSDQFAWAATLFEAFTGRLPFEAASIPDMLAAIAKGTPALPELPRSVRGVIRRGLHLQPTRRAASMDALLAGLNGRGRRRQWMTMVAIAGLGLATTLGATATHQADDRCERLRSTLAAAPPHTDDLPDASATLVREYGQRWKDARVEACEQPAQAPPLPCLEDARIELEGAVLAATRAGADSPLAQPETLGAALPSLDECADAPPSVDDTEPPEYASRIRQVRVLLRAVVALEVQDIDAAEQSLAQAEALAEGIPHRPLAVEVMRQRARMLSNRGHEDEALAVLEELLHAAVAADMPEAAARAAQDATWSAYRTGNYEDAKRFGNLGLAYADRAQVPAVRGSILYHLGIAAAMGQQGDDAYRYFEQALQHSASGPNRSHALSALGMFDLEAGQLELAQQRFELALEELEKRVQPGRFELMAPRFNLGTVAAARLEHEVAVQHFDDALAILDSTGRGDGREAAVILCNAAEQRIELGEPARAQSMLERSTAILSRELGPDHLLLYRSTTGLARAAFALGHKIEAAKLAARARTLLHENLPEDRHEWIDLLQVEADLKAARGDIEAARESLGRALELATSRDRPKVQLTRLRQRLEQLDTQ